MPKGEKLDNLIESVTDNVAPKADELVERLGGRSDHDPRNFDEHIVLRYFPLFVVLCVVVWLAVSLITGTSAIGDFLGNLCLVFATGFAILGILFFRYIPNGPFPKWVVVVAAFCISGVQWFLGTILDYMIYSRVLDSILMFFGVYADPTILNACSLILILAFTLFTTIGVLTVTVTYLRIYLLKVFKSMQVHAEDGVRGKAESFFMVPDIIDVREIVLDKPGRKGRFDSRSMTNLFVYMTILGTLISSYLFLNPYFLDVMSWKVMVMTMVMLCMFIPPLIIPWQSTMELGAKAVSDAPRDYVLGEGAKTKLFYTFTALSAFAMMLMISFYFGFSPERIAINYISFLVPLVLTAWMYSFVYANNFRDSLVDDISERYNEWKSAGRTRP